jgi:hypothetical protein
MAPTCWEDPGDIFERPACVLPLSKDLDGMMSDPETTVIPCADPGCKSLRWLNQLDFKLTSFACDHPDVVPLNGKVAVHRLATAFADSLPHSRGVHAGDFRWETPQGIVFEGRISGITNAGNHRGPHFPSCEQCNHPGVMAGRLCGQAVGAPPTHGQWLGSMVNANYLISFDVGGGGRILGTLEGAITVPCRG